MSKGTYIPITPAVLSWAMRESGFTTESLAKGMRVPLRTVSAWETGTEKPTLTKFRKLVSLLKRTPATFLLETPPVSSPLPIQFRRPSGIRRSDLTTRERHAIRDARRIQETISWILKELREPAPRIPRHRINENPEDLGATIRNFVTAGSNGSFGSQWQKSSEAWRDWQNALQGIGVLVFRFSLGKDGCAGFSLWDEYAPIIAVNTAWNDSARIFSLFHEFGHLITRTSSACLEPRGHVLHQNYDDTERWCERFAAAVLIPHNPLIDFLKETLNWRSDEQIDDLEQAKQIAKRFKVSLRSSVLRLIELGLASWSLYDAIPPYSDDKRKGGGGLGRVRGEIKRDQYGERALNLFLRAMRQDILGRSEVLDYLDVPDSHLDMLERQAG